MRATADIPGRRQSRAEQIIGAHATPAIRLVVPGHAE
jgi:hypothetical protein